MVSSTRTATAAHTIGQLAHQAGLHVQTLRYYETEGLLVPSARTAVGQRRYSEADARRLHFIPHAREFGFSVEHIRELLALASEGERLCAEADALARPHHGDVRRRTRLLRELEAELDRMVSEYAGGRVTDRRVLEVLGNQPLCHPGHVHATH